MPPPLPNGTRNNRRRWNQRSNRRASIMVERMEDAVAAERARYVLDHPIAIEEQRVALQDPIARLIHDEFMNNPHPTAAMAA